MYRRDRRRTRDRRLPLGRRLRRGRQPMPAHGLPARQGYRQQRHPDLSLASRPVRPLQRRHLRPVRRRRASLSGNGDGRAGVGRSQPAGRRSRRPVVPPPRGRDGAQHPARDRQVRPRTQLVPGRLPDAADYRREVRHDLLRQRLGAGPDDDDLLGQHARESPGRRPPARPLPGHQAGCRRMRRKTSQIPGRSSAHRRDSSRGLQGMVPRLHRGTRRRGRGALPSNGDRPRRILP